MARNYDREYDTYQGRNKQKKDRAQRNKARRQAEKAGRVHKGDGKDVHHKGDIKNAKNTRVVPKSTNRSFSRKGEKGHGTRAKKR